MKLEFSEFVGFIHKQSVTMHGHTIIKLVMWKINVAGWDRVNSLSVRVEESNAWRLLMEESCRKDT